MTSTSRRHRVSALTASIALVLMFFSATSRAVDATREPAVLGHHAIGYSVDDRPIVAYHLGTPSSRVTAVVVGQMHGDEHAGVVVAKAILRGRPVRGINLWVIPTMNPDGRAAGTRQNAHGVDLNRNWPYKWARLTGEYYSGRRPLSEPETRAMYNFLRRQQPDLMVVLHQPLDGVDLTDGGARRPAFRQRLSQNLGLPGRAFRCWSVCHGNMTGWLTQHQSGAAITVEFPAHPTHYELATRAPRGIVWAFGGHF